MLRIIIVAGLVGLVAAGCGVARPQSSVQRGVPPALADRWESQASAIATAASTGDSCGALRLANALRSDVRAQEQSVPLRLRSPLLSGVDALAARLTCTVRKPPHKPPGHKHDHHDNGHHGHGDGGGNDQ